MEVSFRKPLATSLVAAGMMIGLGSAHSAATLYTNEAAYLAAVGASTTYVDFAGQPGVAVNGASFAPAVTFISCEATSGPCDFDVFHNSNAITDMGSSVSSNGVGMLGGLFPTPVYAFGFNYISGGMGSIVLAPLQVVDVNVASSGFVGIVSTTPLEAFLAVNQIFVTTGGADRYFIDDFRINAPIPEPATWGLMALGLAAVGVAARRQRRQPVASAA